MKTDDRRHESPGLRWRLVGRRVTDVVGFLDRLTGQSRIGAQMRNFWLLVISVVVLISVSKSQDASQRADRVAKDNQHVLHSQIAGRHFAVGVTCAAISAISEAGRLVITGSATQPETPFTRELERLGYPPRSVRLREAESAGRVYVEHITHRIQIAVGNRRIRLVRPDGSIDCARLQSLARSAVG